MIDGFVNPLLAWGALLAAVPLVIHLLNRRRHRPLAFGAMRFVLAAHLRTRRRTQLESLILLLLRMLAIALLAFALARPFVGGDSLLTGIAQQRRDVVLIVDTSASTGYREGMGNSLERCVAGARAAVESLDETKGDRVRLIIADGAARIASLRSTGEALAVLDTISEPSPTGCDLAAALALALECADEWGATEGALEILFLCDMQRQTFAPLRGERRLAPVPQDEFEPPSSVGSARGDAVPQDPLDADGSATDRDRSALLAVLDRLAERGLDVAVHDLGPDAPHPPNVGVVDVAVLGNEPSLDAPSRVQVAVHNFGPSAVVGLRVALEVEGTRLPVRSVDIGPGATESVEFAVRWQAAGERIVRASIASDALAIDDERALVATVTPPVRVVLVNGAPSDEALELDEVGLLAAVLTPPQGSGIGADARAPFEPRVVSPQLFESGQVDLAEADVVWLANVAQVSTRAIESLTAWVRGGGALVFSLGDAIAPATYGQRLFSDDGSGLLPARLLDVRAVADRRREYWRVGAFDETHPALRFFADERFRRLLVEVPIFQYVSCKPLPDARVLASIDDGDAPLLVEREFGRGRVYLLTTTIDAAWTRLPESPKTLVPLAHEWLRHAARERTPAHNVDVGEPLVVETTSFPRRPTIVLPSGARRSVDAEPAELPDGRWSLVFAERADRPGAFTAEALDQVVARFAVRFDPDEGALARLLPQELGNVHAALHPATDARSDEVGANDGRGELWRQIAWLVFALLAIESLYSALIGRRRRRVA